MRKLSGLIIFCVTLILCLGVAEFVLRKLAASGDTSSRGVNLTSEAEIYARYSPEERDGTLPLFNEQQGGEIVRIRSGGTSWRSKGDWYHPYYGYRAIYVDEDRARTHLEGGELSVVFVGGSTMGNLYTPNYLTSIDNAFHNTLADFKTVHSLNLAEVGARSTNEIMRFMLEVVPLNPDVVVFLDGYNEFTALGYGRDPETDYHWMSVNDRVNAPLYFLRDRVIEKSALLQALFWQTGYLDSPQRMRKIATEEEIVRAAELYVQNTKFIHQLCKANDILCLSFLQPNILTKLHLTESEQASIDNWLVHQPHFQNILEVGYQHIRDHSTEVIDLSDVLGDTKETIYFDWPHLSKEGNARVGEAMARVVREKLQP